MKNTGVKKDLSSKQRDQLIKTLKERFEKNVARHKSLDWEEVRTRLQADAAKLWSLHEMEATGGEPDVIGHDKKTGEYIFFDCSPESPKGRVAVCYDRAGLESRKEHRPKNTAIDMATAMGVELLDEAQYHELQKLGEFDLKTTTWVKTPPEIQKARRGTLRRSPLRPRLHLPQRRAILLQRSRFSELVEGVNSFGRRISPTPTESRSPESAFSSESEGPSTVLRRLGITDAVRPFDSARQKKQADRATRDPPVNYRRAKPLVWLSSISARRAKLALYREPLSLRSIAAKQCCAHLQAIRLPMLFCIPPRLNLRPAHTRRGWHDRPGS